MVKDYGLHHQLPRLPIFAAQELAGFLLRRAAQQADGGALVAGQDIAASRFS